MTGWKGVIANLAVVDETRAYSPLPPVSPPQPEPPVYGTPTAPIRFIPFEPPAEVSRSTALGYIVHSLLNKWRCSNVGGLHVCWSGRLPCPLCLDAFQAVCDGAKWRVPDHSCRILAPFLDEARRHQR